MKEDDDDEVIMNNGDKVRLVTRDEQNGDKK